MKIAFPTDEHYPYQDDRAREVAMMIVHEFDPDLLVVGSDGMDFYGISHFDKDPARIKCDLQKEIDLWRGGIREWKMAAPRASLRYLPGNHEDRLRKWLWAHPEVAQLEALRLDNLLGFKDLGIEWDGFDYLHSEIEFFDRVVLRHGRKPNGKAELLADHFSISTVTGHTHRGSTTYVTTRLGTVTAQESFCLCRLDPAYMAHPNWQQGIVLIEVDEDRLRIDPVLIESFQRWKGTSSRKCAHWRGMEYMA